MGRNYIIELLQKPQTLDFYFMYLVYHSDYKIKIQQVIMFQVVVN